MFGLGDDQCDWCRSDSPSGWQSNRNIFNLLERLNVVFFVVVVVKKGTIESVYKPSWHSTMVTVTGDLADQAAAAALVTETH